jgi:YVTN family beta-propeller protein
MNRKIGLLVVFGLTAILVGSAPAIIFVEETINVGNRPLAMLYDSLDQKVFVANYASSSVSVINPATNVVTATIQVDSYPTVMCWSPTSTKLYVVCTPLSGGASVTVVDAYSNAVINTIPVGVGAMDIVWSSVSNKAYCLNNPGPTGSVSVIDCASDQVVATISFTRDYSSARINYNPVNNQVYASNNKVGFAGHLTAIDCAADQIVATVTCQNNTVEVEVNPVSNKVYAANTVSNSVTAVNCATNQRIGHIVTRRAPTPLLWAQPNLLFVGEYWDSTLAYLHGDSLRIPTENRVKIGGYPTTLLLVPDCHQVFSALDLQGQVVVLDSRYGFVQVYGVLERLSVGSGPKAMAYYPPQSRVFVANSFDSTVTVIRTEVGIEEPGKRVPRSGPALVRAMPSPASAGRSVSFAATGFTPTRLDVRDVDGRLVHSAAGNAARAWQATATGVYFCTLSDGAASAACKLAVR